MACRLVNENYRNVGLQDRTASDVRVTKYHFLPQAKTFVSTAPTSAVSVEAQKVIGTITVVPDSELGFPLETIALESVLQLRREGKRAAEFTGLASDAEGSSRLVVLKLFRLAFEYCKRNGIHVILAGLTERHAGFYQRLLGFKPIGEPEPYALGNGMLVQAHMISVDEAEELIERRGSSLEKDAHWADFWESRADMTIQDAFPARLWFPEEVKKLASRSVELLHHLDEIALEALDREYQRYGERFQFLI